ncbi:hypothetical protein HOE31_01040 [bacterium]|jgi:hypothetical protein|nr:hypothetical protein [bacterium]MBT4121521.1 hypothetical protein [bacterium]MBT4335497.1 hypothetical protein [bacterium]MBT4495610.1 hypothetical protein [bacterium]MBT4764339.1 hypothetical protein [bacterium]
MLTRKVIIILLLVVILTGCTKVVTDEVIEPVNTEPILYENIDLSVIPNECVTWFDGCNDCIIINEQVLGCTEMYCETLLEPECRQWSE